MKIVTHHLVDIARQTIRELQMIGQGGRLVVAVSGGPDSMALLHVLNILKDELEAYLTVAHLDHLLRHDSGSDAEFVRSVCEQLGTEFHLKTADVRGVAISKGLSIEEAGRLERYSFFREVLERTGSDSVATAHHFDDAVETFFLRILRGTSLTGMRGIPPVRGKIVRPFIKAYRSGILEFLKTANVPYRTDFTNAVSDTDRNFVRNEVLTAVERRFKLFRKPLRRSLALLEKEERFLDQMAEDIYERAVFRADESERRGADNQSRALKSGPAPAVNGTQPSGTYSEIIISIPELVSNDEVLIARVLLMAFHQFGGAAVRWQKAHVDAAIDLLNNRAGSGTVHLPQNIIVSRHYETLMISRKKEDTAQSLNLIISREGRFSLPDYGELRITMMDAALTDIRSDAYRVFFDAEAIDFPFIVRYPEPGDRMKPWGMTGTKKLKNIFIDLKIPAAKRKKIPVVLKENEIIWIPGIRRSSIAPITGSTTGILSLELCKSWD